MKRVYLSLIAAACFSACEVDKPSDSNPQICPAMACTNIFMSVTVKFVDAQSSPQVLKSYSSVNLRTKDTLAKTNATDTVYAKGFYLVASDNHTSSLSEKGDTILVKGTHPNSNQTLQGKFVVKGGKCACHLEKVSGPAELKFN